MKNIISAALGIGVIAAVGLLFSQPSGEPLNNSTAEYLGLTIREPGPTLTIGSVSTKPKEEYAKFLPFAEYLAREMRGHVSNVRIHVAKSTEELAQLLRQGAIDIYIDSPFSAAVAVRDAGAVPWMRRWKRGRAEYHSVIFVRADSAIDSLDELQGKVIAFDEPFSTSGYLLPKSTIIDGGKKLIEVRNSDDSVPDSSIGYVFSEDDENTLFWVLRRKVSGGALSSSAFERFHGREKENLKVIDRSISVPRQVVVHRDGLQPDLKNKLESVILSMETTRTGQFVLHDFESTTRFDPFTPETLSQFQAVQSLIDTIGKNQ